jgi:arylsulfatase A-like enzyme
MDVGIGVIRAAVAARGMADNTIVFMTTDNGPHQGVERTNIMYSTGHMLRQCKASVFEGGIRVPGIMHLPPSLDPSVRPTGNLNVTTPVGALDVLPTIMELLDVDFKKASKNPNWVLDGTSMLPFVKPGSNPDAPRPDPLIFSFGPRFNGSQQAIVDNDWKILTAPSVGQCDPQPGYGARFSTEIYTGGCHWFPRLLACSSCMRVINGIPLGCSVLLLVHTANRIQTLKV